MSNFHTIKPKCCLKQNQTPVWNTAWTLITLILIIALDIQFLLISSPSSPPPVTIDFRLNFYHFLPDSPPPASTPSTGCHKCMAPTLEFFNIRSLQIYLGQKLVYLGIFGLKSYMRSAPSNLPNCKVWCKMTILKFGTILICVFLGVEFENTIVILETNTSNLSNCKISRTRMPKFGTKNA